MQYGEKLYNSTGNWHNNVEHLREFDGDEIFIADIMREAISKMNFGKAADKNGLTADVMKVIARNATRSPNH